MMILNRKFRYLDAGLYDRVEHLVEIIELEDKDLIKQVNHMFNVMNVRPNQEKFISTMTKLETHLLKKSNYNFVMKNIPQYAKNAHTQTDVKVTYSAMRETLDPFGKVSSIFINHGVGYFTMKNNLETHNQLNNMQIGKNIIQTLVV